MDQKQCARDTLYWYSDMYEPPCPGSLGDLLQLADHIGRQEIKTSSC